MEHNQQIIQEAHALEEEHQKKSRSLSGQGKERDPNWHINYTLSYGDPSSLSEVQSQTAAKFYQGNRKIPDH